MKQLDSIGTLIKCLVLGVVTVAAPKVNGSEIDDQGFVHPASTEYVAPDDPLVLEALDNWQDQKFGIMFHWGVYSVPGISESWPLCGEEKFAARREKILPGATYQEFKDWYWGLSEQLNPVDFDPEAWATMMKDAGCRYLVFTTKHHDGFNMFDTRYSDYSIAKGPYRDSPYADVTGALFDAFRKKDFLIGAYYSKPDWHCPWYWVPGLETPDRNMNYLISEHPDWWQSYKEFTAGQIDELMTNYGRIDILWLDGGWVKAPSQDIGIDNILDAAREKQPGLITVDRTVKGRNENYTTPEMTIPEKQLPWPWETNTTMTNQWGWSPTPVYKSARRLVNMLIEIIAKGGNFLLDVGPDAKGNIEQAAQERLAYMGAWLRKNGEAVYGTRPTSRYNDGRVWFTASKNGRTLFAFYALEDGEDLPATVSWSGNAPKGEMVLLSTGEPVEYSTDAAGVTTVKLPDGIEQQSVALKYTPANAHVTCCVPGDYPTINAAYAALDPSDSGVTIVVTEDTRLTANLNISDARRVIITGKTGGLTVTGADGRMMFTVDNAAASLSVENLVIKGGASPLALQTVNAKAGVLDLYNVRFEGHSNIGPESKPNGIVWCRPDCAVTFDKVTFADCQVEEGQGMVKVESTKVTLKGDNAMSLRIDGKYWIAAQDLLNAKPIDVFTDKTAGSVLVKGYTKAARFRLAGSASVLAVSGQDIVVFDGGSQGVVVENDAQSAYYTDFVTAFNDAESGDVIGVYSDSQIGSICNASGRKIVVEGRKEGVRLLRSQGFDGHLFRTGKKNGSDVPGILTIRDITIDGDGIETDQLWLQAANEGTLNLDNVVVANATTSNKYGFIANNGVATPSAGFFNLKDVRFENCELVAAKAHVYSRLTGNSVSGSNDFKLYLLASNSILADGIAGEAPLDIVLEGSVDKNVGNIVISGCSDGAFFRWDNSEYVLLPEGQGLAIGYPFDKAVTAIKVNGRLLTDSEVALADDTPAVFEFVCGEGFSMRYRFVAARRSSDATEDDPWTDMPGNMVEVREPGILLVRGHKGNGRTEEAAYSIVRDRKSVV